MRLLRRLLKTGANLLCSALSGVARFSLCFVSADSAECAARQCLKDDFQGIAVTQAEEQEGRIRGSWQSNRLRLRKHALRHDPRGFLTWDVIRETMFPPPYAPFARNELAFLRRRNWLVWRRAIRERAAGLPMPSWFYPLSSANAIHHAYHLSRLEAETGFRAADFGAIFEFGGGYGSLCRIAHGLGFAGKYVIFDLPEQSALQRYYLGLVGIRDVVTVSQLDQLVSLAETSPKPKLFIATWSLSESPVELRRRMSQIVRGFDAFLIAYQSEFGGVDNQAFFREWRSWFPEVTWKSAAIERVPASAYLFGVRKQSSGVVLHTGS